ncbi:hypothetical protein ACIOWM_15710 [Streptomyces anulatus]
MGRSAEPRTCPHRAVSALSLAATRAAAPPDVAPGTGRTALHGHG